MWSDGADVVVWGRDTRSRICSWNMESRAWRLGEAVKEEREARGFERDTRLSRYQPSVPTVRIRCARESDAQYETGPFGRGPSATVRRAICSSTVLCAKTSPHVFFNSMIFSSGSVTTVKQSSLPGTRMRMPCRTSRELKGAQICACF